MNEDPRQTHRSLNMDSLQIVKQNFENIFRGNKRRDPPEEISLDTSRSMRIPRLCEGNYLVERLAGLNRN